MQNPETCRDWIEQLRYQLVHLKGTTQTTWTGDYWKVLKQLPMDEPLTAELLESLIAATNPNTKSRKRACMVVGAISRVAKIDYDPSPYAGKYGLKAIHPRDLVDDVTIATWYGRIPSPAWRWCYGMMATYGLRPHEVFRLDHQRLREGDRVASVELDTKTGERLVWAFHPEWFDRFNLAAVQLPSVDFARTNERMGNSATDYFRKTVKLPFRLYVLRHCWSIRSLLYGLPDTLAAQQQGHSVDVHQRLYQRWTNRKHHQMVYEALLARPDRPRAPDVENDIQKDVSP